MIKIYKLINNIPLPIMIHNTQNFQIFSNRTKKTVRCGLETVALANLPQDYRPQTSLFLFKAKIRNRNAEICECRIFKHCKGNLGFIFKK